MKPFQLPRELTISGLRRMYASKEATPRQVIAEILKRADRDKEMNIWITPPAIEHIEPYLAKLDSLDPASSPLWGIPF
ncbi:allophanate hydrolase, partial [Paenibacillus sepulcri]|nr:allophanate hydrolase [Paenibacillus sepulcri]